jgi:hypothetical protein
MKSKKKKMPGDCHEYLFAFCMKAEYDFRVTRSNCHLTEKQYLEHSQQGK